LGAVSDYLHRRDLILVVVKLPTSPPPRAS
jgi:hypothetical protein